MGGTLVQDPSALGTSPWLGNALHGIPGASRGWKQRSPAQVSLPVLRSSFKATW